MGPIDLSEMREGDSYVRENLGVTGWGCLEQETKLHPLMPLWSKVL